METTTEAIKSCKGCFSKVTLIKYTLTYKDSDPYVVLNRTKKLNYSVYEKYRNE